MLHHHVLEHPNKTHYEDKIKNYVFDANERVMIDYLRTYKKEESSYFFENDLKDLDNDVWKDLCAKFPAMKNTFLRQKQDIGHLLKVIVEEFNKNKLLLEDNGIIKSDMISDINVGMGDLHNGKSTAIVELEQNEKLVYKPNSGRITLAYNTFLDWLNTHVSLGNYKYKVLDNGDHHWLEFVDYEGCQKEEEIQLYYVRAGFILCVVYLLNGSDFHAENIIAHGSSPILIDHETVTRPKINVAFEKLFKQFGSEEHRDSVLNTLLLPSPETFLGMPKGLCGFGWHKEKQFQGLENVGVNRFTKDWKMVPRFVNHNLNKQNIPMLNSTPVYSDTYINELLYGFEICYKLFMKEREFLLGKSSPLHAFEDTRVRFIWRPTNVYGKIQKQMKVPKHLKCINTYEKKIRDYLSVAFKNVSEDSKIRLILEHEITQMLRGDIPYFEIDTSSRDLITEHGIINDFFELSCIENTERKLKKLSEDDLKHQKRLIIESIFN
jgi:type 2 lantibiotic biosynthesis protein LanM